MSVGNCLLSSSQWQLNVSSSSDSVCWWWCAQQNFKPGDWTCHASLLYISMCTHIYLWFLANSCSYFALMSQLGPEKLEITVTVGGCWEKVSPYNDNILNAAQYSCFCINFNGQDNLYLIHISVYTHDSRQQTWTLSYCRGGAHTLHW